ncbi:MAG: beta-propeller fold lactonase family protein [Planctomycetes bacterium]|nr:beta-propeller fold lactonase family protein [Planctomycetota bacterium]
MTTNFIRLLSSVSVLAAVGWCVLGTDGQQLRGDKEQSAQATKPATYRSPADVAISPDGKTLYVSDSTGRNVTILDAATKTVRAEIALRGKPRGVALSADGSTLYVAEHGAGTVAVLDTAKRSVVERIAVGRWPMAVAISPKLRRLYVANQDNHTLSVIDLAQTPAKQIKQIALVREPSCVAVSPDERTVVVTNMVAHGRGTDPKLSAVVSIVDAETLTATAAVKLPPGSSMVQGVCISPDGKWAYVVHGLGRFNLPITQLERGWVNTFALSAIDLAKAERVVTVLLDDLTQGAADPHSVVCSADGKQLWISHAGVHEVSRIDVGLLKELLAGNIPAELAALKDGSQDNIWVQIQKDRGKIADLENDLTALYIAGAIRRFATGGKGPRGLALSPDGKTLAVANYYAGSVVLLGTDDGKIQATLALGPQPTIDPARRGEIIFHDATMAFQRWHSCASCHPNEGRVDGLRWDFLADGIGNAKDTMNLTLFHKTEPLNRRATVAKAYDCVRGGLEGTNMLVATKADIDALYAYLTALRPEPSIHLTADGKLTESAQRGKTLFEGKAACARCHPAPYFTDKKMHNVGVLSDHYMEKDGRYDTPALFEAYRTGPYLHDGRAMSIQEIFTTHNPKGKHGKTGKLSEKELDDLVKYVLSL